LDKHPYLNPKTFGEIEFSMLVSPGMLHLLLISLSRSFTTNLQFLIIVVVEIRNLTNPSLTENDRRIFVISNSLSLTQMLHGDGIFTYIYPKNDPNVGKYSIHGASG